MTILNDIFDVRARLHTFNSVHNSHALLLPDSLIEESIHLIYHIENLAQHHKEAQHQLNHYLQTWRPIFLQDSPPGDHPRYANAFVFTKNPLTLYEYDAHGNASAMQSITNSPFLKSWLHHLKDIKTESAINHMIYQINPKGLHNFNSVIRNHKKYKGTFLLKGAASDGPTLLKPPSLIQPAAAEHSCLGDQAIAIVFDYALRILSSAPYLDSQHFIHYFLGALSLSLKTHYQQHGFTIDPEQIRSALHHISMGGIALSLQELTHYEHLVLNSTRAAHLTPQHMDQYPPALIKDTAILENHLHREAEERDLASGMAFQESYCRIRFKKTSFNQHDSESIKVRQIANMIDHISFSLNHTVEWRLHRQWQYIHQQVSRAAEERNILEKVLGLKSLRQRCLEKLQRDLELMHPAVMQKKPKLTPHLQVIENSDYSGSTERTSFESNGSHTEKPVMPTEQERSLHIHQALSASHLQSRTKPKAPPLEDHHANSFNHYFLDTHRSFFHSPQKIYCEPLATEEIDTETPTAHGGRHKT